MHPSRTSQRMEAPHSQFNITDDNMSATAAIKTYLEHAIASFDGDPPDNEFLRGYEDALKSVYEDLFMTTEERIAARAERMKRLGVLRISAPRNRSR